MIGDIRLHPEATAFLETLDKKTQKRIITTLKKLKEKPTGKRAGLDIKKMRGKKGKPPMYRVRIGTYRAVYAIEGNMIWVTEIFPRGRGYR